MTAPRRVAIRGFGKFGREFFGILREDWSDKYEVTAVFDERFEEINGFSDCPLTVFDPSEMTRLHEEGFFESVFVATVWHGLYHELEREAEACGIPVQTLLTPADFVSAADFAQAVEPSIALKDEGYYLAECRSLCAFADIRAGQDLVVFHDGAGHIAREIWINDDFQFDPVALNLSRRVDEPPDNTIFMAGEWCAALRLWPRNYWHFSFEVLDQISVMEHAGFSGTYLLGRAPFAEEIVEMLGLAGRVLWIDELDRNAHYCFEKVYFLRQRDFVYHGNAAAKPLLRLASKLEAAAGCHKEGGADLPRRIFVKRIGIRRLLGSDHLIEKHGFTTVVPEGLSVAEQIRHFHAADVVLCPHGANSTNSLYMRPGTVFVETFGKSWGVPACINPMAAKGVRYLQVVGGHEIGGVPADVEADYEVDDTLLEMAITNAISLLSNREGTE